MRLYAVLSDRFILAGTVSRDGREARAIAGEAAEWWAELNDGIGVPVPAPSFRVLRFPRRFGVSFEWCRRHPKRARELAEQLAEILNAGAVRGAAASSGRTEHGYGAYCERHTFPMS